MTQHLSRITDRCDYTSIEYPTSYDYIDNFEEQNEVCIFVYELNASKNITLGKPGRAQDFSKYCMYLLRKEDGEGNRIMYKY